MNRRMLSVAAAIAVPLSLGAPLPAAADRSPHAEDAATVAAVRAVTDPAVPASAQVAALPDLGYRAATGPGYAIKPTGSCSTVLPLPSAFDDPCRAHDLGYDLLRHADGAGRPLGGWARRAIDEAFAARLSLACAADPAGEQRACREAAGIAVLAVRANSWRQHDGPPRAETTSGLTLSWLTGGGRL